MKSLADKIRDWIVGVIVVVACGLVIHNLLFKLPEKVDSVTNIATQSLQKATQASKDASAAKKDAILAKDTADGMAQRIITANNTAATAIDSFDAGAKVRKKTLKSYQIQINDEKNFNIKLYKWLTQLQKQVNAVQGETEEKPK